MFRLLLLSIISISSVFGQVNIEGLRNPELNRTNFSVEIDSDIATQSNKDNWEITSELRFDKLFDNQSSILLVVEGEYSEQTVDSIKDIQENKGFVHTRYVVPLQSYELETFGQIELDIMNASDSVVVVLVPESGDDIQMMKSGLMEIADLFVINKSDRDGTSKLYTSLSQVLSFKNKEKDWHPVIIKTSAVKSKGIKSLAAKGFQAPGQVHC